ncbi:MAG: hypothetical protein KGL53_10190, partial [Elusimicrobia bacterium]|nr:hypothetical protein [Elusimicrobiota bacterium]
YPKGVDYAAFRLSRQIGFGFSSFSIPASRSTVAGLVEGTAPAPRDSARPGAPPPAAPSAGGEDVPMWTSGDFVFKFDIGFDTGRFPPAVWQDVKEDFRTFLPPAQFARLLAAQRRRELVLVDLKHRRIRVLGGGRTSRSTPAPGGP